MKKTMTIKERNKKGNVVVKTYDIPQARNTWGTVNPVSRFETPKKGKGSYNRKKYKRGLRNWG